MRLCHTLTAFAACFCGVSVSNSDAFVVVGANAGANENMADNLHRNKARRTVDPVGRHVAAAVGPMSAGSLSRLGGGIQERYADRQLVPFHLQRGSVSITDRNSRTILYNVFGDVETDFAAPVSLHGELSSTARVESEELEEANVGRPATASATPNTGVSMLEHPDQYMKITLAMASPEVSQEQMLGVFDEQVRQICRRAFAGRAPPTLTPAVVIGERYARFPTMCLEETVEAAIYGDAFYDLYSAGGWRYASDDECWDETGAFIHRGSKMAEIPISANLPPPIDRVWTGQVKNSNKKNSNKKNSNKKNSNNNTNGNNNNSSNNSNNINDSNNNGEWGGTTEQPASDISLGKTSTARKSGRFKRWVGRMWRKKGNRGSNETVYL